MNINRCKYEVCEEIEEFKEIINKEYPQYNRLWIQKAWQIAQIERNRH